MRWLPHMRWPPPYMTDAAGICELVGAHMQIMVSRPPAVTPSMEGAGDVRPENIAGPVLSFPPPCRSEAPRL